MWLLRLQVRACRLRGQGLSRLVRRRLFYLFFIPVLYVVSALLGGVIPVGGTPDAGPKRHEVHLINGPIHYDILLPVTPQTTAHFAAIALHHPQLAFDRAAWLLIGWGARDFYTTVGNYSDVTPRAVWRGITGDASVMRVDVVGPLPETISTRKLMLSDAQYAALLDAISDSFAATAPLDQGGFGATDRFYPAKGRFHIGRTCNVWVGSVLRQAGVRFGVWTPLPASVSLSHRLYGAG